MDKLDMNILLIIHGYYDINQKYLFNIAFECHYCRAILTNKNLMDCGEYESNHTSCYKVRCFKCRKRYFIKNRKDKPINQLTKKNTKIKKKKPYEELNTIIFSDDEEETSGSD